MMIYIFWTSANEEEAERIARDLIQKKLIACASLLPKTRSIYAWKGKIEESREVKVILKTRKEHFFKICEQIKNLCSYEVPEITELSITNANPDYLTWVLQETHGAIAL